MPAGLIVRRLSAADVQDYRTIRLDTLRLAPEFFGSLHSDELARPIGMFEAALRDACVFGAYVDGQIAGVIRLQLPTAVKELHKGRVGSFFVYPHQRGRGVGSALMNIVIETASASLEQLSLSVAASNHGAIGLYERVGFTRYGTEPRARKYLGVYADLVLMMLILANAQRVRADGPGVIGDRRDFA